MNRIRVLVISGFLGAGKSTLLSHLLNHRHDLNAAVLVNDLPLAGNGEPVHDDPPRPRESIQVTDGCFCCSGREDFFRRVCQVVEDGSRDYLVVEMTGLGEPLSVAEVFTFRHPSGQPLVESAELQALITVVDARQFLDAMRSAATLGELGVVGCRGVKRHLIGLLVDQVEYANVLVLNRSESVGGAARTWLTEFLHQLNPTATIVPMRNGEVPGRDLFDLPPFETADGEVTGVPPLNLAGVIHVPGWLRALDGEPAPASANCGIATWVYTARRPFHPQRLWRTLQRWPLRGVLRSRGFVWLASRPDLAGLWNHAGRVFNLDVASQWWDAIPVDERPADLRYAPIDLDDWHPEHGDRRQDIAFIGQQMNTIAIQEALDGCLLTDEEMTQGPAAWMTLVDPFPQWDLKASLQHLRYPAGPCSPFAT